MPLTAHTASLYWAVLGSQGQCHPRAGPWAQGQPTEAPPLPRPSLLGTKDTAPSSDTPLRPWGCQGGGRAQWQCRLPKPVPQCAVGRDGRAVHTALGLTRGALAGASGIRSAGQAQGGPSQNLSSLSWMDRWTGASPCTAVCPDRSPPPRASEGPRRVCGQQSPHKPTLRPPDRCRCIPSCSTCWASAGPAGKRACALLGPALGCLRLFGGLPSAPVRCKTTFLFSSFGLFSPISSAICCLSLRGPRGCPVPFGLVWPAWGRRGAASWGSHGPPTL